MKVNILSNDSAKNKDDISISPGETLGQLKQRLGQGYAAESNKFVYSGQLLKDNQELSAVLKEENQYIHLFVKSGGEDKDGDEDVTALAGESSGPETTLESDVTLVAPELLGLPKYSTEKFTPRIIIINGQKYRVETGDAIAIPEGVDIQEIRRRMSTSVLKLHLSRPVVFDPAAPQVNDFGGIRQVPGLDMNRHQDIPIELRQQLLNRPIIRVVFNVAEWGDMLGQLFKLGVACYFVFRYLSFTRAVIASLVFTLFFLNGEGFFEYVQRNVFGVRPAAAAPAHAQQPLQNDAQRGPDAQGNNPVEAAAAAVPINQNPETLLGMVQAAIVGFFISMFPENIPQRAAEEA